MPVHEIRTQALLPAAPAAVWSVLSDFDRYAEWNPLNIKASGKAALGARIPMTFINPAKAGATIQMKVKITRCEPGRALEWIGEIPFLFRGRHFFDLTPEGTGTRLLHGEDTSGLIASSIKPEEIKRLFVPAYEALNAALANRLTTQSA